VERTVDLPVAGAGEPVPDVLAGGGIDGSGAVPRGEMSLVGEVGRLGAEPAPRAWE